LQFAYTFLNSAWEKKAFVSAGTVVAVSHQVRRELESIGVAPDRINVILNGVDIEEFRPGHEDRATLGLPENVLLGLFAGDIRTPRKNLETVLRALVDAPGVHLAIAGRIAESPYPKMAESLGIAERAHFLDFRTDIAALMRASDMFVFPSRYEACSLVLLEALASGLPTLTARSAGGSEIVDTRAGFVLDDPNDAETLASHLRMLRDDPDKRRSMATAARSIAERHSWAAMADAYLGLYSACRPTDETGPFSALSVSQ
jgi:glycosyltransferase involved in cell wall biosynthesis